MGNCYEKDKRMENSIAYKKLVKQINAVGREKLDGYYQNTIEEIYDWEREEVEVLIWNTFHEKKDTDLALFLPKLKSYDGIAALKRMLQECKIPSRSSVNIAKVLYDISNKKEYLDILFLNYKEEESNLETVSIIASCKPSEEVYDILVNIYISNPNSTIRSTAADGILYNKGYISNPNDIEEIMRQLELSRKFMKNTVEERKKIIAQLEAGNFRQYQIK